MRHGRRSTRALLGLVALARRGEPRRLRERRLRCRSADARWLGARHGRRGRRHARRHQRPRREHDWRAAAAPMSWSRAECVDFRTGDSESDERTRNRSESAAPRGPGGRRRSVRPDPGEPVPRRRRREPTGRSAAVGSPDLGGIGETPALRCRRSSARVSAVPTFDPKGVLEALRDVGDISEVGRGQRARRRTPRSTTLRSIRRS